MNLSEAFNSIKNQDHTSSFDELGSWLDQQPKPRKKMNSIYKIAASITITAVVLIACTVPVETEEEIGYMIKGIVTDVPTEGKAKINALSEIDLDEVSYNEILHETIDGEAVTSESLSEVVLLLPEANMAIAERKALALESVLDVQSIEILPISETIQQTYFEQAVAKTFDVKLNPELTEVEIAARINRFMHENSTIVEEAEIELDENGNRKAVFRINMYKGDSYEVKRDIETLYYELTPNNNRLIETDISEKELERLKLKEIEKMKEIKEKADNNQ